MPRKKIAVVVPDGYISVPDYLKVKGCSRTCVYRQFKPVKFGGRAYLPISSLDAEVGGGEGRDPLVARASLHAVKEVRDYEAKARALKEEVARLERAERKRMEILKEAEDFQRMIRDLDARKEALKSKLEDGNG